jgi:hypothetical protein
MDESSIDGSTRATLEFIRTLVDDRVIRRPMDYQVTALAEFDVSTWFERDPAALEGHKFIQFGQDGTGSGYCLWYYPTLGDRRPPVVFWGSEGDYVFVAGDADDFARQLTSGMLPYHGRWLDPDPPERQKLDLDTLRRRAESRFGVRDAHPDELRAKGPPAHPDFEGWVRVNWE